MKRLLKWLWVPDWDGRVVKAISWTEFLFDGKQGSRTHVYIDDPAEVLLRFGLLGRRVYGSMRDR